MVRAADERHVSLPPFQFGVIQFDDTVLEAGKRLTQKVAGTAEQLGELSDFALLNKRLARKDLNELLQEPRIARLSKEIYDKVQQEQQLTAAFSVAFNLTSNDKDDVLLEQRTEAWKNFRSLGARTLSDLRKEQLPAIQNPDPRSADMHVQLLERNRYVTLTENEQALYTAYYVMLFAMRQIHRTFDAITDRDDLLLHQNVTKQ